MYLRQIAGKDAMFAWTHRKEDALVGEMLLATFQSYRNIFERDGIEFLERTIRFYPGLIIVPTHRKDEFEYRYPNEMYDLVFLARWTMEPCFQAQGETTYPSFIFSMALSQNRSVVSNPKNLSGRAKRLAKWLVSRGAMASIIL